MRRIGFAPVAALAIVLAGATGAVPDVRAAAHSPAMPSDFNGDGSADLAIGAPGEAVGGTGRYAGSVNVLYGSSSGLTAAGDQLWSQDSPGVKGRSEGAAMAGCCDRFGTALASGDFNRDGFADLAIGAPDEKVGRFDRAGVINVLYGSRHGLTAAGDDLLAAPAIAPSRNRAMGQTVAVGDVNGDGYDDLVTGAASGFQTMAIIFGSATGLHETGAQTIDGSGRVAIGDLDGDGFADLALGLADDDRTGVSDSGAVEVRYGSATGPSTTRVEVWTQDSPGIDDEAESSGEGETYEGEYFGQEVAIGDVDGDGDGDLIVATPGEIGGGAINVILGSPDGLTAVGSQFFQAGIPAVLGTSAGFGFRLAAGDLDGDGDDDLAIGGVMLPEPEYAGARISVLTLDGGASGLALDTGRLWWQDTPGVPGRDEPGDWFAGSGVTIADYDKSGESDLAIGVGREDLAGRLDAGAVVVLYGAATGLGTTNAQIWSQNSRGVRGASERLDAFGSL